jgi:hypothetical protein
MMTNGDEFDRKSLYEIRVLGTLDPHWSDWFDGFAIQLMGDETLLVGEVADQAALLGAITKIVNLSLTLLKVERKLIPKP